MVTGFWSDSETLIISKIIQEKHTSDFLKKMVIRIILIKTGKW